MDDQTGRRDPAEPPRLRLQRRSLVTTLAATGVAASAGCAGDGSTDDGGSPTGAPAGTAQDDAGAGTDDANGELLTPTVDGDTVTVPAGGDERTLARAFELMGDHTGGTLRFESGRYPIDVGDHAGDFFHLQATGLEDVTVAGNGATLVFQDPNRGGLHFADCTGLTVRGLTIDYDPVPFTVGSIESVADGGRTFTVGLDDAYPALDHRMFDLANKVWGSLHDPETGAFIDGTPVRGADSKYFSSIQRVGEGRFELSLAQKSAATGIEPGRMLVVLARGGEVGGAHALAFMNCDPPVVEDCTVHASPAFPVFTKLCGEPIFRNVNVVPPEDGRPIASDADGIHVRNSVSGPTMEDCTVRRLEDDGFIVDTLMLTVSEIVDDNTVRVEELVGTYAEAGDVFDVMSPTGDLKGALSSVAEVTYYRQSERIPGRPKTITFEEPIADAVSTGDFLANRSTSNRGFTIRNCTVENHRARGIRVTAGPGVIEDNTVRGSSGQGLLFECGTEGNWPPKRWAHDVTVRNNTISNSGMVWLSRDGSTGILAKHRTHTETTGYPHYGITVENNTIRNVATYGAKFADASDLTLRDNEFSRLNQLDFDNADYGVVLEHDDGVELSGNRVAGPTGSGDPVAFGLRRNSENVSLSDDVLVTADGERPARLTQWVPLTFSFSHTVVPSENDPESTDDRHLAFMVREVTLHAGDGSTIRTLNVGRDEDGMQVGEGVYGPIANDEGSWRWLGGSNATATIFLRSNDLESASSLEIRGNPVEAGVETDVSIDGDQVAHLALGERTPQTYTVNLDG